MLIVAPSPPHVPGSVFCLWCKSAVRGWLVDVKQHLGRQKHSIAAKGPMNQFVKPLVGHKRTQTEVSIDTNKEFLCRTLLHAEGCGISYAAFHNLMSDEYLSALHNFPGKFPTPSHMRATHFNDAVSIVTESVEELVKGEPFSLLVDETPQHSQDAFVLISIATPYHFFALNCKCLPSGESINAQRLFDYIQATLLKCGLESKNFVGYVSDNVAYAKKAFKLLLPHYPHLKRVGCLSHVLHLLSKAVFSPSKGIYVWPLVDILVENMNQLFSQRNAADERLRQERFQQAFGIAPRPLFWLVSGRWACKLRSVIWMSTNRVSLLAWLKSEHLIDTHETLPTLIAAFENITTRAHLAIVVSIVEPLHAFLVQSQDTNVEITMEMYNRFDSFIAGLHGVNNRENAPTLVNLTVSDQMISLSADALRLLQDKFILSVSSIVDRYTKHLSYLSLAFKYFLMLSPSRIFRSSQRMPNELYQVVTQRIFAIAEFYQLTDPAPGTVADTYLNTPEAQRPSTLAFWTEHKESFPQLAAAVLRLAAMQAGIAGVERQVKQLRAIQIPQRLSMSDSTLEGIFLMRCNAATLNVYQRGGLPE